MCICGQILPVLTPDLLATIRLSLLLAGGATLLVLPLGLWLGWLLARRNFPGKILVEILVMLPLVLPPTVTGYALLMMLRRNGVLGGWELLFTWKAMLAAAAVAGFPLLVRSAQTGFADVDPKLEAVAHTLGCSRLQSFLRITLPLAWPGLLTGAVLCLARGLGEFGATRMVALNTPSQRTLALEIYHLAETPGDHTAVLLRLVGVSLLLSALALLASHLLTSRWRTSA